MSDKATITSVLKEATEGILTEDALAEIEAVFEESVKERVALHVEKALAEQDDDHAAKLEKLLEAIDTDHTGKLNKLVEAINTDHASKLAKAAKKFNKTLNEDASVFKEEVVNNISNYLELYLERAIPQEDIKRAMNNTSAVRMLKQLREALAVDSALAQDTIRGAVKDGKNKIQTLDKQVSSLNENNEQLTRELVRARSQLVLESRTKDLPETKRKYMFKVLGNKTPEFIEENYDYTLKLLEKTEEERLEGFKKEAASAKQIVDRPTKKQVIAEQKESVVTEDTSSDQPQSGLLPNYMDELRRT
jgi:hypothetical protein